MVLFSTIRAARSITWQCHEHHRCRGRRGAGRALCAPPAAPAPVLRDRASGSLSARPPLCLQSHLSSLLSAGPGLVQEHTVGRSRDGSTALSISRRPRVPLPVRTHGMGEPLLRAGPLKETNKTLNSDGDTGAEIIPFSPSIPLSKDHAYFMVLKCPSPLQFQKDTSAAQQRFITPFNLGLHDPFSSSG
ncbi:unnamed protein product [Coccothraustes coccothraustes]